MQPRLAIGCCEQRAPRIVPGAIGLGIDGSLEVNHESAGLQARTIGGIQHRAAAGGEHNMLPLSEFLDNLPLAPAETRLAFFFEYQRDVGAGAAFNLQVSIQKFTSQEASECTSDSGFPGPHGADEEQPAYVSIAGAMVCQTAQYLLRNSDGRAKGYETTWRCRCNIKSTRLRCRRGIYTDTISCRG